MGAVNVLSTVVSIVAVDRLGRRFLLLQAGFQMFLAQVIYSLSTNSCSHVMYVKHIILAGYKHIVNSSLNPFVMGLLYMKYTTESLFYS